jgi:hypothetical protein
LLLLLAIVVIVIFLFPITVLYVQTQPRKRTPQKQEGKAKAKHSQKAKATAKASSSKGSYKGLPTSSGFTLQVSPTQITSQQGILRCVIGPSTPVNSSSIAAPKHHSTRPLDFCRPSADSRSKSSRTCFFCNPPIIQGALAHKKKKKKKKKKRCTCSPYHHVCSSSSSPATSWPGRIPLLRPELCLSG